MGGNGTLGGGRSLAAHFTVWDKNRAQKDKWDCVDNDMNYPFDVILTLPSKDKITVTIRSEQDKITVDW